MLKEANFRLAATGIHDRPGIERQGEKPGTLISSSPNPGYAREMLKASLAFSA